MKYFTPELYLQFNSADDGEADRADGAWEEALGSYERHLESFRNDLPVRVKQLADERCFHDAEVLSLQEGESEPIFLRSPVPILLPIVIVTLKQEDQVVVVVYLLWGRVRHVQPAEEWKLSPQRRHWLYDEVDLDPRGPGLYWQRVLLSDGAMIEIPFVDVFFQTLPIDSVAAAPARRKRA